MTKRKRRQSHSRFATVFSKETLLVFLKANRNPYNDFMLQKINEAGDCSGKNIHHIIPIHAGGCDENWNLVYLTLEDYKQAHQLRYEVYNDLGDFYAVRFWSNPPQNTREAQLRRIKLSHQVSKQNQTGFFSSEQQRKNGQKGGSVKSQAKIESYKQKLTPVVAEALSKPMKWKHKKTHAIVEIEANAVQLIAQLRPFFVQALPEGEEKQNLVRMPTADFTSAISKVLKGQRRSALFFVLLENE